MDNNDLSLVSIAEPSVEHYEAFIEACKNMQDYINDDSIQNDVAKHESKGFIFAKDGYANMSREEFERIIVNGYKEKAQDGAEKPEYFRFIMCGDTIVGSVNVRGLQRDTFDETNGLSTFEKWKGKRVTGAEVVLPDYRGKGIFGKAQSLFFDEMRKQGINEITFTVLSNNESSEKAHDKIMDKYGGRMYQVYDARDGSGIKYYNRYVISTDTSGKSKDLYKDNKEEKVSTELAAVRQKIAENKFPSKTIAELQGMSSITKDPYKTQTVKINPNTLRLYQGKMQKSN